MPPLTLSMDVCSFARLFDSAFYQHFYLEMCATDNEYRTAFLTIATKTQIDCCCNDRETSEWKYENEPTLRCQSQIDGYICGGIKRF